MPPGAVRDATAEQALPSLLQAAAALDPSQPLPGPADNLRELSTAFLRRTVRRLQEEAAGSYQDEGAAVRRSAPVQIMVVSLAGQLPSKGTRQRLC